MQTQRKVFLTIHFSLSYIQIKIDMSEFSQLDSQIELLYSCRPLPQSAVIDLCEKAKEILMHEPNLVTVNAPVIICGDIHGQFYDLMELFAIGGKMPDSNYLFLGDYVNRGHHSVQTFTLLLALKVRYRDRITLLRGNHEAKIMSQNYGCYDECVKKYGNITVWKCFTEVFDCLPLSAIVAQSIFCVHAGLSPSGDTINDIKNFHRFRDIPHEGLMTDLVWTDPDERPGWGVYPKGNGYSFGTEVTKRFLHQHNLQMIARAHQLAMEGYNIMHEDHLVTIFSAPNYCNRCANLAAIMCVDEHLEKTYIQFDPSPTTSIQNKVKGHRYPDYFL